MLTVLLIVVAAGLVVASVLTDSLPLAIVGLVGALVALGLVVWPVLMARRAAAVAAEEREEATGPGPGQPPVETEATVEAEGPSVGGSPPIEEPAGEGAAATPEPAVEESAPETAGPATVLVVPGRHRYHRVGCSMLEGRAPETLARDEATEEGFTPCSRCLGDRAAPSTA